MTGHLRKRTTKAGITWQIVLDKGLDANGKRLRQYIACNGSKKQAQIRLNEILAEYNKGMYVEPTEKDVRACIDEWLTVYAKPRLAPNTVRGYCVNLENHTIPYIGHIVVQKLTPVQIQSMYAELEAKGLSSRSIRYVHTTLRAVLQYAYKMRYTAQNVADFVSPPKQEKPQTSVYSEQETLQLLECAKGTEMAIPLALACELGLRRGELLALKWQDIDWQAETVSISRNLVCINKQFLFSPPKTSSGNRTLLLSQPLQERLKAHQIEQNKTRLFLGSAYTNHDLICCKADGNPFNTGSFSHKFSSFLEKNSLRKIRLHDLRHTNATLMLQYGVPAKIASQRLGHANISITLDTYSHVSVEMQEDAVSKLASGVLGKLDEKAV